MKNTSGPRDYSNFEGPTESELGAAHHNRRMHNDGRTPDASDGKRPVSVSYKPTAPQWGVTRGGRGSYKDW